MKIEKPLNIEKLNPDTCFKAQLNLESLDLDSNQRIIKIDTNHFDVEKDKDNNPPKIMAVKSDDGVKSYFSSELNAELLKQLEEISRDNFFCESKKIIELLSKNAQFKELGHYITYIFSNEYNSDADIYNNTKIIENGSDNLLKEFSPDFYNTYEKAYAVMQKNKIASCCVSSRENDSAGEAWVFTHPDFRKRGLGSAAVKLWANELMKNGKIPFYSHEINNKASGGLANKLELIKMYETISYE